MFRLTRVAEIDENSKTNGYLGPRAPPITLPQLVGGHDLREMWQFNFTIDPAWVMDQMHQNTRPQARCVFVAGWREPGDRLDVSGLGQNVEAINVPLASRFGTHHCKLMVLFKAAGNLIDLTDSPGSEKTSPETDLEAVVVVHTANLIPGDWDALTQMAWISPRLRIAKLTARVANQFQTKLCSFLAAYPAAEIKKLAARLAKYDFSQVQDRFIASVPGHYRLGGQPIPWGMPLLKSELLAAGAKRVSRLVVQVSSVGVLPADFLAELARATGAEPPSIKLVFPTIADVARGLRGYRSGVALHFGARSAAAKTQSLRLQPMLCRWRAAHTGRDRSPPHVKTYTGLDDSNSVEWLLVTSANLSKQAWGTTCASRKTFWIQSYECGVLRVGHIAGQSVPYDLPVEPYKKNDEPWSPQISHMQEDCLGQVWCLE